MAGIILLILVIAILVVWVKAVVNHDGSRPDFCEDCDPMFCPFPCEKNMRK